MSGDARTKLVGINHVALEVGDLEAAIEWYGRLFELSFREPLDLRHRGRRPMAFVDMGDQFLALAEVEDPAPSDSGHFGLVVDDREATRARLEAEGIELSPSRGLEFRDPWGNLLQVVDYREIQMLKDERVLRAIGLAGLEKSEAALEEIREAGFGD